MSSARRPTSRDVAREAGVSRTAVSLVMNDRADGLVEAEKQQRIRAVAERLGYVPNATAVSLQAQRTFTVGLVTDQIASSPFAGPLIAGANEAAMDRGYFMLAVDTQTHEDYLEGAIARLRTRGVDGLVYAGESVGPVRVPEAAFSGPFVLANAYSPTHSDVATFVPDDYGGGLAATRAVLGLGHRDIVFLSGTPTDHATKERVRGFREAFREAGLTLPGDAIVEGDYGMANGYESAHAVLSVRRPTALICANDRSAVGAMLAAARLGIDVPRELSIIGYDDEALMADSAVPRLTTVRLPHLEMGRLAVDMLIDEIEGVDVVRSTVAVECALVWRDSLVPPSAN